MFSHGLLNNTLVLANQQKHIYQLSADTGCRLEDLQKTMANRDRWQGRIKGINAATAHLDDYE